LTALARQQNVEQDVLDCLDEFLSSTNRHARIDTSVVVLSDVVVQFERRAKKEVAYTLQHMPAAKRRPTHVFFCENPAYGAFALRSDRYDYIVLHIGIVPAIIDFCMRMMANPDLWENIGTQATATDDPARTAFATIFMSECLGFVVRHELAPRWH
jgi:hypothetical protein